LCQEQVNVLQDLLQGGPEAAVARPGAVGNARIHYSNPGARMRRAQKIRPEFSLREDNQPGPQRHEIRSHRESKIQREVEDVVLSKMLFGQPLARGRGG
jgi:hypothetical protein